MLLTPAQVKGKTSRTSIEIFQKKAVATNNESLDFSRGKKSLSEGTLRPSDLLAQFKHTEARTRTQIWAAELLDNTVELIREMVYTHTMVQPTSHGTVLNHCITCFL